MLLPNRHLCVLGFLLLIALVTSSHGPMRIRRHDALVNIVYNKTILVFQRNKLHPGDAFHPDFQYGPTAYSEQNNVEQ